jgi:hypothetical protein
LAGIFFATLGIDLGQDSSHSDKFKVHWENATDEGQANAEAISNALAFARDQATQEWREFAQGFSEQIEDAVTAWERLIASTGFDLGSVFRRRELVPFVLIPRHVSSHHGSQEKLSLLTHLQQAHEAFIFGVPFAALALMRSVLEVVLVKHYGSSGKDLRDLIDNARSLPSGVGKRELHELRMLANDILHFERQRVRLPQDMERKLLSFFVSLRSLIEGTPQFRHSRSK